MFTGLVQATAAVAAVLRHAQGVRLQIDAADWGVQPALGDSICISGVCLTIAQPPQDTPPAWLTFDVVAETLSKTTLGRLEPGRRVNLEPAVTPAQPLGGHFMQGHVDGLGVVTQVRRDDEQCRITVKPPASLLDAIVPRGSIAIDGVSLTLARVEPDRFEVALIPTTLRLTTLGELTEGDAVNLEADILAKTVVHYLERRRAGGGEGEGGEGGVTVRMLRQTGFA